ncbi:MAG: O-acetyl-ADP-ribose deacetylase [Syntrophothermus sp.]
MKAVFGKTTLELVLGDITQQETEAIVNAANSGLLGGGGVDGAIHRAGGPDIARECAEIRRRQGGCPPGEAVITTGGKLKARYVIHTVGPIWDGGDEGGDEILRSAYLSSLRLAKDRGIGSLAFPSISTGAYGFPVERAARIALRTIKEFLLNESPQGDLSRINFVLFSERDLAIYKKVLQNLLKD